ncbi:M15 family peptidase [Belliella kenyensis]|uniref:M15 family peptidase n=1 Tax=Belliella kenyensis TaxID=1472724 RepID=A0ABV8EP50_9BACT|nr:M15 family peptidase [Belliella kenyensis]MCH7401533.1 M15 family peptidase [Belliella kenyensis]MDN3603187.1 M15 family peptidase [Belliella kenyensis]
MDTKEAAIFVQTWLSTKGLYTSTIDGIPGPLTYRAIDESGVIPQEWSNRRKLVGMLQYITMQYGQNPGPIDGYFGPNTLHAFENAKYVIDQGNTPPVWRPEELAQRRSPWPKQYTPEFDQFYGKKGSSLVYAHSPYELKIAWNTSQKVSRFMCHEKVKDSIEKVLRAVLNHYGPSRLKELRLDYFGGCYNDRSIRGGTLPSMHSWGIAIDFDPSNNQLNWGRDRATFARTEYHAWWEIWESEGWVSLGRLRNFDWMHVQAASL